MDGRSWESPGRFAILAVSFEMALGLLAFLLGLVTGHWPWATLLGLDRSAMLTGLWAGSGTALVLFAGIILFDYWPVGLFKQLQATIRQYVIPLFRDARIWHLIAISVAAGIGEELFFRGYCQTALSDWLSSVSFGQWWALAAAALLFGICHWISSEYAIVATAMGLVLGGLFLATGNLVAPIIAHAFYDFLALLYLTRKASDEESEERSG